ncbi:hypothetical protein [Cellulomonas soli]|uniref:Uncharacterized protein n=1 Tax=Cellulomonas soli TaxID=931535 RepID=A0A512PGH6_9CELL|nr:hypothetical protein [Cellulomonas soli]NYI58165.1 hypothetical protein [Cellulomonas soli]GEP70298.1 hypothetical protein CSO01_30130 [Cellulomonas soli]
MTSSSTDARRRRTERSTWVRMGAALLLGLLALAGPALAPTGSTGAVFVDEAPVTTGVTTAPTFAPTP